MAAMLRLACPTGCAGTVPRPFPRRAEPVQCPNCRAWLAAPERVEDGGLAQAVVLAEPGRALQAAGRSHTPRRPAKLTWAVVLAIVLAVVLVLWAALAQRARSAGRANEMRSAPTNTR
jgi:hypothetical protein